MADRADPAQTCGFAWHDRFRADGVWSGIAALLVRAVRAKQGRAPEPTTALLDSQSVVSGPQAGVRGVDGNNKHSAFRRVGQRAETAQPFAAGAAGPQPCATSAANRPACSQPTCSAPCAPELNPQENMWQHLRQNQLPHRVFADHDAIVAACCTAWNALMAMPDRIRSIAARARDKTVVTWGVWYHHPGTQ